MGLSYFICICIGSGRICNDLYWIWCDLLGNSNICLAFGMICIEFGTFFINSRYFFCNSVDLHWVCYIF